MLNKEKRIEQNIHVINAKKCHLGSCTLREEQSGVGPFKRLQALNWAWWYWGRKQETKRTNQNGVGRRCGENEKGWNKTHIKSPQPYWNRGSQKDKLAWEPSSPAYLDSRWWLPPTFLVSRVRGHMWVLGGFLDMEVHVVQLHVQADRRSWVTVHCGLETADWGALARTGRIF